MNCEILRIHYLRANGVFACNCSAGDQLVLGRASDAELVVANAKHDFMAGKFAAGEAPWGDLCRNCVFFREQEPFTDPRADKLIEKFHIEPSLACALRCPGCNRIHQAKTREGDVFLDVGHLRNTLSQLRSAGYSIGYFFLCGAGEPLSHPGLEELLGVLRELYPNTQIVLNTNGNYDFAKVFARGVYPDRLLVSVDGARQGSYEQYRVRGDIAQAFRFMRDAKRIAGSVLAVDWKYILFTYNDSDEELLESQRLAEDMGIDSLQYVFTHTPEHSRRYTVEHAHELPIVSPLAYLETTPHLYHEKSLLQATGPMHSDLAPAFAHKDSLRIVVDKLSMLAGKGFITGWAMEHSGLNPRELKVLVNGSACGSAQTLQPRPDVLKAFPASKNPSSGFRAFIKLPENLPVGQATVSLRFLATDGTEFTFDIPCRVQAPEEGGFNSQSKA